ncbi:TPA: type IV secretion system protein [Stenotrophomonas maltophilia]|nr:type IV secretion system protein [Stenotrophomonas maltophilia]MBC9116923.1 type IV secretion system protein [Stenotrophomonas maltophilia]MBH1382070.1 type IV secretion system protein [Stenotrophomonas maltophilia]MBH1398483.1 type IV secretion system protein [Stenotrophomonas maltophilia]MBH1465699.1 type IV secretion system protein [Stenotrophomonas maltophilia]
MGHVARVQSIGDFVFFKFIFDFLRSKINKFGIDMMGEMMQWVGGIALTLMTLWVLVQGFRIVTGRSRDSMMVLVTNMARAALIVSAATTMGAFGTNLQSFLTHDVKAEITKVVTGSNESPEAQIDKSLAWMQVALSSIDAIQIMNDGELLEDKKRALFFIGMGTAGPAITAGAMLMLYEIAMALFIGFGPLFILCLLFDQTKQLFQRWLFYGIGTMFSMAVLAAMVSIALDMVVRVAATFWTTALVQEFILKESMSDGMTSQAMQQGGMGLILTALILTTPPMAAMFFQGTLGTFMAYSQIGGGASASPSADGRPPGMSAPPPAPSADGSHGQTQHSATMPRLDGSRGAPVQTPGTRGNASGD